MVKKEGSDLHVKVDSPPMVSDAFVAPSVLLGVRAIYVREVSTRGWGPGHPGTPCPPVSPVETEGHNMTEGIPSSDAELVEHSWRCLRDRLREGRSLKAADCTEALSEVDPSWAQLPRPLILELIDYADEQKRVAEPRNQPDATRVLVAAAHLHAVERAYQQSD